MEHNDACAHERRDKGTNDNGEGKKCRDSPETINTRAVGNKVAHAAGRQQGADEICPLGHKHP